MTGKGYPGRMDTPPTGAPTATPATTTDWLRLDQQICFSLNAASRAFGSVYRVILKDLGITYPQYLVLLVLWERGETTVKELASALRLDYGTVSPLLKRLEAAGLVRRERAAADERSVLVACTGRAEELRERATCVPGALLEATALDSTEAARLREELRRLAQRADAAAERPH